MFAFEDRRLRPITIIGLILSAAIIVLYLEPVHTALGGEAILWIYDTSIILLAWLGAALSFLLARRFERREVLQLVWLMLGIGLLLWGLGEAIWAYYELVLKDEPYGSYADIAYVTGYIPLLAALLLRYRSLQTAPERRHLIVLVASFVVLVTLVSVYIFVPILSDPETPPVERFISILYPLGDLLVGFGALLIVLVLIGGRLSLPWLFIALGFIVVSAADLVYTYGYWQGLYLSGEDTNFISALADVPYYLSYIIINFGLFLQARLQKII